MSDKEMYLPIDKIVPNKWNVNAPTEETLKKIREDMMKYGERFVEPITVRRKDDYFEIVDGEQRWRIAKELGWEKIPVIVKNLSDEEAKRLCLSYNITEGNPDWIKLSKIMRKDLEERGDVYVIYEGILTRKEIKAIIALDDLSPKIKRLLKLAQLKTGSLTPEHLVLLMEFPEDYLEEVADIIYKKEGVGKQHLRELLQEALEGYNHLRSEEETDLKEKKEKTPRTKQSKKEEKKEEKKHRKKHELRAKEGTEERGKQEKKEGKPSKEIKGLKKGEEITIESKATPISLVCDCGRTFRINFEKRSIERL